MRIQHDLKRDRQLTTNGRDMTKLRRLNRLMAQRVEVAIVFKEMLGAADSTAYMAENGIPQHVAERVLAGMTTTRTTDGAMVGYCQHDPDTASREVASEDATGRRERAMVPIGLGFQGNLITSAASSIQTVLEHAGQRPTCPPAPAHHWPFFPLDHSGTSS